jgi:flavin-binding protein dodecin
MPVQKALDLLGEGPTVEAAVEEALDRAATTIESITTFEVRQVTGSLDGGRPSYRAEVRVWFTLLERIHG